MYFHPRGPVASVTGGDPGGGENAQQPLLADQPVPSTDVGPLVWGVLKNCIVGIGLLLVHVTGPADRAVHVRAGRTRVLL